MMHKRVVSALLGCFLVFGVLHSTLGNLDYWACHFYIVDSNGESTGVQGL